MDLIHRLALRAQESTPVIPSQDTQESVIKMLDSVLATEEYPSDHAPPLDIIIYALNNILRPAFLPELMPDFLHLFTMVEFYRRRVVEKASLAIEMNTFYSDNSQANVVLLDDEDKRILKSFVDEQKHGRRIFLKVIKECCIQDLERLWLMDSNVDYWVRCHEYLSIRGSPVTFRFGLTDSESEDFERGVILKLKDFMYSTVQTGEQLLRKGKSHRDAMIVKDFQRLHTPVAMNQKLLNAIDYHQKYTQDIVAKWGIISPKLSQSVE